MHIAFLHTAEIHVETFEGILQSLDSEIDLTHIVRSDLLDIARKDGLDAVRSDVTAILTELSSADAVV